MARLRPRILVVGENRGSLEGEMMDVELRGAKSDAVGSNDAGVTTSSYVGSGPTDQRPLDGNSAPVTSAGSGTPPVSRACAARSRARRC